MLNPELVKLAAHRVHSTKRAFVPSDAAAGGGGGGAPAGPPPGGDPSGGGGGAPPPAPDPSMGGGGGGLSAGVDPMAGIAQTVTQAVQQGMAAGGGGAGGAGGGMKPAKADINTVAMDIFQVKKILMFICRTNHWELPPDILDGPNRDPSNGAAMPPGAPGSTSDPNQAAASAGGGQQSAIQPIEPMQGAFPAGAGGGGEKSGSVRVGEQFTGRLDGATFMSRAAATAALCRSRKVSS